MENSIKISIENIKKSKIVKKAKRVKIDKNMVIFNNQHQKIVGTTFKSHPAYPSIGDRVVIISNQNKHVKFGSLGTVTGTYKLQIEILFDEPFIGGTNLSGRCSQFKGGILDFYEIFNISKWPRQIHRRSDLEKRSKASRDPEEWQGKVDMTALIRKMNEEKRKYDQHSFKSGAAHHPMKNAFRKDKGGYKVHGDRSGYRRDFGYSQSYYGGKKTGQK